MTAFWKTYSTNGTYVNQQLIDRHLLEDGDIAQHQTVFRSEQGLAVQLKRLSLHPKLMDTGYPAWLQIMDGSKIRLHYSRAWRTGRLGQPKYRASLD